MWKSTTNSPASTQRAPGRDPLTTSLPRADLHCHSRASTEADEAVLNALQCPECFSEPLGVYEQAKQRRMDFVTITDHDSIAGVAELANKSDVIVGEELTCYFPEDHCKMHVLVWGITQDDHAALQKAANDIYAVAALIEARRIAHAVAHPVYRQNDTLERWHLERMMLLFKGFECLNGAHSALHREAFEPMLDELTPERIGWLARSHKVDPRWPEPWVKARTGGSDDHGLLNIGRTWTEFPADCTTTADVLDCLRTGRCRPGGEAGSSLKLAHNFFSVGIRFFGRRVRPTSSRSSMAVQMLGALVGDGPRLRKRDTAKLAIRHHASSFTRRLKSPFHRTSSRSGAALTTELFQNAIRSRLPAERTLCEELAEGRAPLAEHEVIFRLINLLNRDVTNGIVDSVTQGLRQGELDAAFDALSSVATQQFMLLPYYFALFHQNRERPHFPRITGYDPMAGNPLPKVGLFTDCLNGCGDAARFTRAAAARATTDRLLVATCEATAASPEPWRKNFVPLSQGAMPFAANQPLALPPVLEVLEWADRQQFDSIHADTAGPMGFVGWLVSRMLRVPFVSAFHADVPRIAAELTGDHRLTQFAEGLARWFYCQSDIVLTRSRATESRLQCLGVAANRIRMLPPEVDTTRFDPGCRDVHFWNNLGIREPRTILYRGPLATERSVLLLVDAFSQVCRNRADTALVFLGDGPLLGSLRARTARLPVYFLTESRVQHVPAAYASSDLFVFPSRIETLGQAVIEAQACGVPVLVSDEGGPREMMDDGVSGLVLPGGDAVAWAKAMETLLSDEPLRQRLARTAPHRVARFARARAVDTFWDQHTRAVKARAERYKAEVSSTKTTDPLPSMEVAP